MRTDTWAELWDTRDSMLRLRDDAIHRGLAAAAIILHSSCLRLEAEVRAEIENDTQERIDRMHW